MTWQLGRIDGVVDAVDAQGRPYGVALPDRHGDLFSNGLDTYDAVPPLTFQPLVDPEPWTRTALVGLGFTLGFCSALLAVMLR